MKAAAAAWVEQGGHGRRGDGGVVRCDDRRLSEGRGWRSAANSYGPGTSGRRRPAPTGAAPTVPGRGGRASPLLHPIPERPTRPSSPQSLGPRPPVSGQRCLPPTVEMAKSVLLLRREVPGRRIQRVLDPHRPTPQSPKWRARPARRCVTPPSQAPAPPRFGGHVEAWIEDLCRSPGPSSLTMSPPADRSSSADETYSGDAHRHVGHGQWRRRPPVFSAPPGRRARPMGRSPHSSWLASSTNAAGQISFDWSIATPGSPTTFSAAGIRLQGDAPGTAPPTYAPPAGSGGQVMLVSGASEVLGSGFSGQVVPAPEETGTLSIHKTVPDAAYFGPGGAVFNILNGTGSVVDTLTTGPTGSTPLSAPLPAEDSTGTVLHGH